MNLGAARFFLATKKNFNEKLHLKLDNATVTLQFYTTSQITRNEMHRKRNTSPVLNTSNNTPMTLPA